MKFLYSVYGEISCDKNSDYEISASNIYVLLQSIFRSTPDIRRIGTFSLRWKANTILLLNPQQLFARWKAAWKFMDKN